MDFEHKVVLTVLDKGLLAIVVVIVGFVGSRLLERYKAKQVRETELVKAQLQAMSSTWSAIIAWRDGTNWRLNVSKQWSSDEWTAMKLDIERSFNILMGQLATHRPLTGLEYADTAEEYVTKIAQYHYDITFQRKWDETSRYHQLREEGNRLADIQAHFRSLLAKGPKQVGVSEPPTRG